MKKIIQYIGLDVHKDSITVAIAADGGEVRHYGKIGGKLADVDKLIQRLQKAGPDSSAWLGIWSLNIPNRRNNNRSQNRKYDRELEQHR